MWGGYTAAAGHYLYTARSFPKEYWDRIAFINEPTAHLIGQARHRKRWRRLRHARRLEPGIERGRVVCAGGLDGRTRRRCLDG